MFSKTRIKQLFLKLLMFFMSFTVILSSDTIYSLNNGYLVLEILLTSLFVLTFLIDPLWNITYTFLLMVLFYVVIAIILCVASNFSMYSLYYFGFLFPVCLLIVNYIVGKHRIKDFLNSLLTVLTLITIISLFFWLLGSNLKLISPTSSILITWGDIPRKINSYYNLYFESQGMPIDGLISHLNIFMLSRNSSIFVEGVIANFFFCIGFILSDLLNKGNKYKLLYLLAILSTFTTSGFLVASMFILHSVVKMSPKNIAVRLLKAFAYLFTILFVVCFAFSLITDKTETISGNDRRFKIASELAAFIKSPIYGNGVNTYTKGSSNALSAVAADGGILLLIVYYYPLVRLTINNLIRMNSKLLLFLSLFFLFETSVVQYTPLMLIGVILSWEMILVNRNNLKPFIEN